MYLSPPEPAAQHLPSSIRDPDGSGGLAEGRYSGSDDERAAVLAALDEADGSRTRAGELLGMSRTTLWRRMREYGLTDGEE